VNVRNSGEGGEQVGERSDRRIQRREQQQRTRGPGDKALIQQRR
jgi:hypothetical protein